MFSSIFSPFERIFTLSRARANTASVKLDHANAYDALDATRRKGEIINHLLIPPARKEVPLSELLQASKRKSGSVDETG